MKETCWDDCIISKNSVKVSSDVAKSRSLVETAKGRIDYTNEAEIKESNANYILEDYYTSILEIVHANALLSGYKINNHICTGFYLRDILKRDDLFRIFDDLRFKRNSLTYYGKKMDFETAKIAIINAKSLIKKLFELK
jgi:hypothetical protein